MAFFTFDDHYVRRLRERDRETLEHFYAYFFALLYHMVRRKTASDDEAKDVMQDIFLRVLQELDKLREPSRLGPFVCGFAKNILREHVRMRRHESLTDAPDRPDPFNFLKELESKEMREHVRAALSRLEPREASLLKAVFLDEADRDEICLEYGVNRDYLRVLLHRAIEHLRAELAKEPKKTPRSPETFGCLSALPL